MCPQSFSACGMFVWFDGMYKCRGQVKFIDKINNDNCYGRLVRTPLPVCSTAQSLSMVEYDFYANTVFIIVCTNNMASGRRRHWAESPPLTWWWCGIRLQPEFPTSQGLLSNAFPHTQGCHLNFAYTISMVVRVTYYLLAHVPTTQGGVERTLDSSIVYGPRDVHLGRAVATLWFREISNEMAQRWGWWQRLEGRDREQPRG